MTAPHPYDRLIIQRFELELLEGYIDQAPIGLEDEVVAADIFKSVRNRPTTSAEQVLVTCPQCKGTGKICGFWESTCSMCGGKGEIIAELRQQERER